jgi:hypothetical protein
LTSEKYQEEEEEEEENKITVERGKITCLDSVQQ